MVTLATGPTGPGLAARIGGALGGGFGQTFVPAVAQKREDIQLQKKFDPLREALISSLGTGGASTPGQQLVQQITQTPELFAQFMGDPEAISSAAQLTQAAAPVDETLTGIGDIDEINKTFELAQQAVERGEPRRAEILFARVNDLVGLEASVDPDLDILQLVRAGGDGIETIQGDGKGNFFDVQGNPIELAQGDRIIESASISDTTADVLGETEARKLNDAQVNATNFLGTVDETLQLLQETPDLNTFVAGASAAINDLQTEARAFAENLGLEFDTSLLEPSRLDEAKFDKLGIQNRRVKSLITSLAFQAAAAASPGDRVSEKDVDRFINEIGGSAADPRAFAAVLNDIARRSVRNFKNNYKVRTKQEFPGDLGLSQLPGFQSFETAAPRVIVPGAEVDIEAISNLTDEDLLGF